MLRFYFSDSLKIEIETYFPLLNKEKNPLRDYLYVSFLYQDKSFVKRLHNAMKVQKS